MSDCSENSTALLGSPPQTLEPEPVCQEFAHASVKKHIARDSTALRQLAMAYHFEVSCGLEEEQVLHRELPHQETLKRSASVDVLIVQEDLHVIN